MTKLIAVALILAATSTAAAAPYYRGDYPQKGKAWNHAFAPCKKNPKQQCYQAVQTPQEMSTFGGAGAGGGGGAGAGAGAGGGSAGAGGSSW